MRIEDLGEPDLEFGNGVTGRDPKRRLANGGPFGSTYEAGIKTIPLGLVGLPQEVGPVRRWVDKMHSLLLDDETNVQRFHEFPGAEQALRSCFTIEDRFIRVLDEDRYKLAWAQSPHSRFSQLLELYSGAIKSLFLDQRPGCILVCFPEAMATLRVTNPRLSHAEQRVLERLQEEEETQQMDLFEPTVEEKKAAAELLPQAEELLFRNFHRALKAMCMLEHNCVPIQVVRRHTYISDEAKQSNATRAWNLGVALYYKSGNIPWRPSRLSLDTCFVGVSFHHLKKRSGDLVYASVAQAFSSEIEPFALKGEAVPRDQTRNKRPYLTQGQAANLAQKVVLAYKDRTGCFPTRVIVHKTSRYEPEESEGFRSGLLSEVAACDLVWMTPTGFRLLRRGMKEPIRGTLCTIEDRDHYLFTTGYVSWWSEYPGPHIPAPLQIGTEGESDLKERAREILALSKMNWNSADGIGRHPITITFARRVGITMTEIDEDVAPNPLYRFYM
jgi:hypothetical protein